MIKFEDETNIFAWYNEELVNPIQDGEGGRGARSLSTSFSPVTSANVRIASPKRSDF